jgi:hypothetical protein
MAKVTVDGVAGEYLPHEVIDLMHAGKITSDECGQALGMNQSPTFTTWDLNIPPYWEYPEKICPCHSEAR